MATTDPSPVVAALRSALADALALRDRTAIAVYRTALSAIDNAAAVAVGDEHRGGAIESSTVGVGRTEAARRVLTRDDEIEILNREVQERHSAADAVAAMRPGAARQLRSDAALLVTLLDRLAVDDRAG